MRGTPGAVTAAADDLWLRTAARIEADRGWSLRPLAALGRPRDARRTWLAVGDSGTVVVKVTSNAPAGERAAWAAEALALLAARGYPVPELLWHGRVDERWFALVWTQLPGEPVAVLDDATLNALLALVELQADTQVGSGGWDVSWWVSVVLFEGWEGWWNGAETAAPETARRLRAFLEPAWEHRLPVEDVVHGDLNLTNVLVRDGEISGVVDWDAVGVGSRALDVTGILLEWQRLQVTAPGAAAADGGVRLRRRIDDLVGDAGLRCTVTYAAIARLALTAARGERDQLATWRRAIDALLDSLA